MENVQPLKLKNFNNSLACNAFIYIHFAPAKEITDADMDKVYLVKNEGEEFFVKLVDFLRFYFHAAASIITLPATGLEAQDWKKEWLHQHPNTKVDTVMCAYYYKKVEL